MAIMTLLSLVAAASMAYAAPTKRSPLDVQLVHLNDTSITAVITNTDRKAYSLLHRNSILDPHPSRKLSVSGQDASDAAFHGIHAHCSGAPSAHDFTPIGAGETLYRTLDVAELYDLGTAGIYDIAASGSLPYASDDGSLRLNSDRLSFSSNILELPVSADSAELMVRSKQLELEKRTTFEDDCSSEQLASVTAATEDCADMAQAAADAATNGDASFLEKYFGDSSQSTRSKVAEVFNAVAKECSNTPGGQSTSHCTDQMNHCTGGVLAYTYWQGYGQDTAGEVYYCPSYYQLPQEGSYCHAQTQGGNVLHEMTHAVAGTDDLGYGYDAISALSTEEALLNADSYTVFAEDLKLGCNGGDSAGGSGSSSGGSDSGSGTSSAGGSSPSSYPTEAPASPEPSSTASWPEPSGTTGGSDDGSYGWPSGDGSYGGGSSPWSTGSTDDSSSSSSSSGTEVWQGTPVDSNGNAQSWNDWLTALMNSYGGGSGSSGKTVVVTTSGGAPGEIEQSKKVTTLSKTSGAAAEGERQFGHGDDHRGHDHTEGSDEHGHWTD